MSTTTPDAPATDLVTTEQFESLDAERVELVRGEIVEMPPPGAEHCAVCANVTFLLTGWCRAHEEYIPFDNDCSIVTRRDPDSVRGADGLVVRRDRLPEGRVPKGSITVAADVAVEVKSPANSWTEIVGKAVEYLDCGVCEVWIVDPESRHVHVYSRDVEPIILDADGVLTSMALPGFSTPIPEFFRGL